MRLVSKPLSWYGLINQQVYELTSTFSWWHMRLFTTLEPLAGQYEMPTWSPDVLAWTRHILNREGHEDDGAVRSIGNVGRFLQRFGLRGRVQTRMPCWSEEDVLRDAFQPRHC